jgi:hypothetical protein
MIIDKESEHSEDYGNVDIYQVQCPDCKEVFKLTDSQYPFVESEYTCECGKEWCIEVNIEAKYY